MVGARTVRAQSTKQIVGGREISLPVTKENKTLSANV